MRPATEFVAPGLDTSDEKTTLEDLTGGKSNSQKHPIQQPQIMPPPPDPQPHQPGRANHAAHPGHPQQADVLDRARDEHGHDVAVAVDLAVHARLHLGEGGGQDEVAGQQDPRAEGAQHVVPARDLVEPHQQVDVLRLGRRRALEARALERRLRALGGHRLAGDAGGGGAGGGCGGGVFARGRAVGGGEEGRLAGCGGRHGEDVLGWLFGFALGRIDGEEHLSQGCME